MSSSRKKIRWVEVLGYIIGGALLLLAAGNATGGAPLVLVVGLVAAALLIISASFTFWGNRRILPVGVTRDGDAIICRYIPWYELNDYTRFTILPIIGVDALVAGSNPGRPAWLRVVGLLVLGVVLLTGYFVGRMWRRCLLRLGPDALTVRLPAGGSRLTEIPRSRIQSIADAEAEVGADFAPATLTQIAIAYRPADAGSATASVLIGPPPGKTAMQLSVHQTNMFRALKVWEDANPGEPRLMDRIEAILRGKSD